MQGPENYPKLEFAFDNWVSKDSCIRRIQRITKTVLNIDLVAMVVMKLLHEKRSYILTMDRTNDCNARPFHLK